MNTFEACLAIPHTTQEEYFSFSFNDITYEHIITDYNADRKITIKLHGNVSINELEQYFLQEYQILFFNYGYFPEIISAFTPPLSYYESGKTNHAGFFRRYPPIYTNLSRLLNVRTLENYATLYTQGPIKMEPIIRGFFSLFSQDYLNTFIEHKIILLLHIIEGYAKYITESYDVSPKFESAVKHVIKECFHYRSCGNEKLKIRIDDHTKNEIRNSIEPAITKIFGEKYHEKLRDMRNYYSHLGHPCEYKPATTLLFLFFLIPICFRVRIINDIVHKPFYPTENDNIKELFLIISDYTNENFIQTPQYTPQSDHFKHMKNLCDQLFYMTT